MNKITPIINQFVTIYEGKPWYGNPVTKILEDITEEGAFWQPREGAHSIAQLVWHMIY